jgi:CheY-like chemotaxis protein
MTSPRRILCVDDEPDIRRILVLSLRHTLHADVVAVASAAEAFAWLDANPAPDVVLLDGMMPGMDGWQTCARLREDPRFDSVPVVFLTARTQPGEQARAREVGAVGCLAKPFAPMSVGRELCAVLERARHGSDAAGPTEKA